MKLGEHRVNGLAPAQRRYPLNDWQPSVPPGMTPEEYRNWWEQNTDVPYGACWCGCGGKTTVAKQNSPVNGHVLGCPKRYIRGHGRRKTPLPHREDGESGCWVWQWGQNGVGYGVVHRGGRLRLAHRWYYEQHKGEIPKGMQVHHRCENRACVNPDHLQAVTQADNIRACGRVKLDWRAVEEIRASSEDEHPALAEKFNTTAAYVRVVWRGINWQR